MFDNNTNGNNNRITIIQHITYQQIVVNNPPQQPEIKPTPIKEKKPLLERLKNFLGFGGAVADFIKKILPIILLALGINSS